MGGCVGGRVGGWVGAPLGRSGAGVSVLGGVDARDGRGRQRRAHHPPWGVPFVDSGTRVRCSEYGLAWERWVSWSDVMIRLDVRCTRAASACSRCQVNQEERSILLTTHVAAIITHVAATTINAHNCAVHVSLGI